MENKYIRSSKLSTIIKKLTAIQASYTIEKKEKPKCKRGKGKAKNRSERWN